jgi:hypothetical protein
VTVGAKHQTQERVDWQRVEQLQKQGLTSAQIRERLGIRGSTMRKKKQRSRVAKAEART